MNGTTHGAECSRRRGISSEALSAQARPSTSRCPAPSRAPCRSFQKVLAVVGACGSAVVSGSARGARCCRRTAGGELQTLLAPLAPLAPSVKERAGPPGRESEWPRWGEGSSWWPSRRQRSGQGARARGQRGARDRKGSPEAVPAPQAGGGGGHGGS